MMLVVTHHYFSKCCILIEKSWKIFALCIAGSAMNSILHNPRSMPATARPGPRVKPEAEMIAMKNRGSMNSIMRTCTPRY